MQNKLGKRVLACVLAITLALPLTLGGCMNVAPKTPESAAQNLAAIAAALREKYRDSENVDYAEGVTEIERDHQFVVEYDFDLNDFMESGYEYFFEIAALYFDAELTQRVPADFTLDKETMQSFTISPTTSPYLAMMSLHKNDYPYGFTDDSDYLFDRGPNADWGNYGTLYLATWVDLATAEPLDKPSVQVVTIKGELEAPNLSVEVNTDGIVEFSWNAVKGAKAYYVVKIKANEDGKPTFATLIGCTTDTQWSDAGQEYSGSVYQTNWSFKTFMVSEDDWLIPAYVEEYSDTYDPADGPVQSKYDIGNQFTVMAVNETGSSMFSRLVDVQDVAAIAPLTTASHMERLSGEEFSRTVEGVPAMQSHRWITLCNGRLSQRLINYDFESVSAETKKWYIDYDDTGDFVPIMVDVLVIPFKVDGTGFKGEIYITEYDKDNYKTQLKEIEARQEMLRIKSGGVRRDIEVRDDDTAGSQEAVEVEIVVDNDTVVTANSALSEYLALSMLSGAQLIDLSTFPEALDQSYLANAWSEAFYQNPLILGVSGVMISRDGKTLSIEYEDDRASREQKQAEIKKEVSRVVSEIISSSMTARDKEFAINQYLCDTVEYDEAALANGEKYEFQKVDSEFYDSFTAYGALLKGVGVCASYSAAFKLLADAAGLDCVVVTGYLNGSLGHAWNRVDLGNGQWATVDSTNNDDSIMPNAVMNISDTAISAVLVEDDVWVMRSAIEQYRSDSDTDEYYRVMDLFCAPDAAADQIVSLLSTNETVVVRTDYTLTETQFYDIGQAVFDRVSYDVMGFYWMGVVVITRNMTLLE